MSVFMVHSQCSSPLWSVFMVIVVSAHGHHASLHFIIIEMIYNAMNADSARIRMFFRLLFGLSCMNTDMSMFMSTYAHIRDNIML